MGIKITYLVANYNNRKYIKDCIDSLQAQTSPDWYCLIADDKSTDDSLAILQPLLSDRIKLIENEENLGYTHTLIKLIDHAPTDIVGILDPDDALEPEATELVLKAYREHPDLGFVYTNYYNFDEGLTTKIKLGHSQEISPTGSRLTEGFVGHLKTFRCSVYAKTTGYDPDILYAEDRDLVYKMDEVTNFLFINRPLYKYRQVPGSQSRTPEKRRIATGNHLQAYRHALDRRQIKGRQRWGFLLWFYADSIHNQISSPFVASLVHYLFLGYVYTVASILIKFR